MSSENFGIDYSDATFAEVSSPDNLLQDIYRAVSTPADKIQYVDGVLSPLIFWDPLGLSFDLRSYCNDSVTASDLSAIPARVEAAFDNDPRFSAFQARASYSAADHLLTVKTDAVAATGLSFTMSVVAGTDQIQVTSAQIT